MAVKTLDELFEHEMKDIYYAEHRLVEALTQLAEETKNREIKRAYTGHKKETQGQIKRLQKVFKLFGTVPEVEKCPGIEGLLKEQQNFTKKEKPSQEILDYFNLGAAAKAERYEITAYESLIEIAQQLGMGEAAELLGQNLQEEQATLDKVKALAQEYDVAALMAQEEEEEEEESGSRGSGRKGSSRKSSGRSASKRNAGTKGSASRGGSSKKGAASGSSSKKSARGTATRGAAAGASASRGSSRNGASGRSGSRSTSRNEESAAMPTGMDGQSGRSTNAGFPDDMQGEMIQTDPATAI